MAKQQRVERQAETRQKLIAAASRIFAAHGYAGAKVELIAEAAMTHVCVDATTFTKQPWPDWFRDRLSDASSHS